MNWKSAAFLALRIVVSSGLLLLLFHFVDLRELGGAFSDFGLLSWVFFACAVTSSLLVFVFAGEVWHVLLPELTAWQAVIVCMKTFSVSLFLPNRIGDFGYVYYLNKKGVELSKSVAAFIAERLAYLGFISAVGLIGLFYFFNRFVPWSWLIFGALALFGFSVLFYFAGLPLASRLLSKVFKRKVDIGKELAELKTGVLVRVSFWNCIRWFARSCIFYYLFLAFQQDVPLFGLFMLVSIEVFLTMVPLTLAGLGARELFAVWAYPLLFGVSAEITLLVYVCATGISYLEGIIMMLALGVEK